MARSLINSTLLAASVLDGLSLSLNRRGYAAASQVGKVGSTNKAVEKVEERAVIKEDSVASSAWSPDPVTGYYKPINRTAEIDAADTADLRRTASNHKIKPH